jgi:hypothetical protein
MEHLNGAQPIATNRVIAAYRVQKVPVAQRRVSYPAQLRPPPNSSYIDLISAPNLT